MNVRFPFLFSTFLTVTAVGLTACGGGGGDDGGGSPGGGSQDKVTATGLYKDLRDNYYIAVQGEGTLTIASCNKLVLGGTKYFTLNGNEFQETNANSNVTSYSGKLIEGTSSFNIKLYQGSLDENASAGSDFATLTAATSADAVTITTPSQLSDPDAVCFDVSSAEDVGVDTVHMLMAKDGELLEMDTIFNAGISIRGYASEKDDEDGDVSAVVASELLSGIAGVTDEISETPVIETRLGVTSVNIGSCTPGGRVSGSFTYSLAGSSNLSGTFTASSSSDSLSCVAADAITEPGASALTPLSFLNSDNCDSASQNDADIDGIWRLNPIARESMEFALNQLIGDAGLNESDIQGLLDQYIEPLLQGHYLIVQTPGEGENDPSVRMAVCEPIDGADNLVDTALWIKMNRIATDSVGYDEANQELDAEDLKFQLPSFTVESSKKISFTLEDLLTSNPDIDENFDAIPISLASIKLVFNKDDATKNESCINTNAVADGTSAYSKSNLTCVGLINSAGKNTLSIFSRVDNQPAFLTFDFNEKVDRTNREYNMGDGVFESGNIFFPDLNVERIPFNNAKIRFIRDYDQYSLGDYLDGDLNYKIHGHYIIEIPDGDGGTQLVEGNFFSIRYR